MKPCRGAFAPASPRSPIDPPPKSTVPTKPPETTMSRVDWAIVTPNGRVAPKRPKFSAQPNAPAGPVSAAPPPFMQVFASGRSRESFPRSLFPTSFLASWLSDASPQTPTPNPLPSCEQTCTPMVPPGQPQFACSPGMQAVEAASFRPGPLSKLPQAIANDSGIPITARNVTSRSESLFMAWTGARSARLLMKYPASTRQAQTNVVAHERGGRNCMQG